MKSKSLKSLQEEARKAMPSKKRSTGGREVTPIWPDGQAGRKNKTLPPENNEKLTTTKAY